MNFRDDFTLDNGNLLKAPGYVLTNLNLHYNAPPGLGFLSRVTWFFAAQNLFDKTYVASASNLTNSLNAAGQQNPASVLANSGGSIYAGSPRLFYSGIRLKF
jgi:iron complex outermembrane receptor protein